MSKTAARLTRTRTTTQVVRIGWHDGVESDAAWTDQWGHQVVRARVLGAWGYWVRCQDGRWSSHLTLDDARDVCAWLQERGR
ncbi:hypothetical protein [Nonomuraea salmonea]|uniref:Uncharacterized protein n=1 Tax=Nonomuraea salmonea TaxID=46181 RepID=A0ABV5P2U8_9ACTN